MPAERILILGGTGLARELADRLVAESYDVETSLAGVTEHPHLPPGRIRRGGFGGVEGLREYLKVQSIRVLIDATHPFAAQMSRHAAEAAGDVPLLRLELPPWPAGPGWIIVHSIAEAVVALPPAAIPLVTIGRKEIAAFLTHTKTGVARMIENPDMEFPPGWTLLQARPPFTENDEIALMRQHRITHLVSKNSGGSATQAKITAARALRLPVIMVARPAKPGVPTFATAEEISSSLRRLLYS
ncbi:cobalt-precorrin-6A reductase [Aestuariivirga sp.]|uniref:cobalt-precorrin-6A reductase n=1 Tax=Aestuariivirga sp. TaxID=2650926 RepID=UPI0039E72311